MKLLDIKDVAAKYAVSLSTVRRWLKSGKLYGQKVGGRWRFALEDVQGLFTGVQPMMSGQGDADTDSLQYVWNKPWARDALRAWKNGLASVLEEIAPDHVIVNDRRGAKVWSLIAPSKYRWGINLWHSTITEHLSENELRKLFARRRVLLFDEMMQFGRQMRHLRERMEKTGALVESFVCVRRRSAVVAGKLKEYEVTACEDMDDDLFHDRATVISRLMCLFQPPLDVDHLVVLGVLRNDMTEAALLEAAAQWGNAFMIRYPDSDTGHEFFTITLDRPQFFETETRPHYAGFATQWNGPCKIRLYVRLHTRECYCSLIACPTIKASRDTWERQAAGSHESSQKTVELPLHGATTLACRGAYEYMCFEFAAAMFADLVSSGAAEGMGIEFRDNAAAIDEQQLIATLGADQGRRIAEHVRRSLRAAASGRLLPLHGALPVQPPPLFLRSRAATERHSTDRFGCRGELLHLVSRRWFADDQARDIAAISYETLFERMPRYSEVTVGQVLDYELDWGTVQPDLQETAIETNGTHSIEVSRVFYRGEYGPWFEWDSDMTTHEDALIQKTMGLGPSAVDLFLKQTGEKEISATHFAKLFANMLHDWRRPHGKLYLAWEAYKYGAIPIVPRLMPSGEYAPLHRFLVEMECLTERTEKHGTVYWRRYAAPESSAVPWQRLFKKTTDATTRAHFRGLVRLYAAIQQNCKTLRPSNPKSQTTSEFSDPLVVLGSARNNEVAYRCAWFEVADWLSKGELLFAYLQAIALSGEFSIDTSLERRAAEFAAPARLLAEKIEMYRNLPHLRAQIERLAVEKDLDLAEVLLETTDTEPVFRSDSKYPMANLEWGAKVMRAFTSMLRQVLTTAGVVRDKRTKKTSDEGAPKDAASYLAELLASCPELKALQKDLDECASVKIQGPLREEHIRTLCRAFGVIGTLFGKDHRIPDPRSIAERNRSFLKRQDGLIKCFQDIQMPSPYTVAVCDIYNLRNLIGIGELLGTDFEDALSNLIDWVEKTADKVARRHPGTLFAGVSGDTVIFAHANPDEMISVVEDLHNETTLRLNQADRRLAQLGLFRTGLARVDNSRRGQFATVRAGLTAYRIGDRSGRTPGTISLTREVLKTLSEEMQNKFSDTDDVSDQGEVLICEPASLAADSNAIPGATKEV